MYYLMNKNNIVATIEVKSQTTFSKADDLGIVDVAGNLPIGFDNINYWIENRKGFKHNAHLQAVMKQMGCDSNVGFIRVTHASTINDTFWIKHTKENISWEQVSLYRNQFTETISKLAFEGIGLNNISFSSTSPELTCDGSFRKCFRKEEERGEFGSDIFLYKRGYDLGQEIEPYCEMLASEIAMILSPSNFVGYELVTLHGKIASKCNLFTSEDFGYVPFSKLADKQARTLQDVFDYFEKIGSEQLFREMLIVDALCFNQDRHSGNYGALFNNDTLEIYGIAPIFDLNICLLPYVATEDLANVGDKLYECAPKLGDDFTRLGQLAMNDIIRPRVQELSEFSFMFRGDDTFTPLRIERLENIVRQQAKAVLRNDKVYTKDVFVSPKAKEIEAHNEKRLIANELIDEFATLLDQVDIGKDTFFSVCDSGQLLVENLQYTMTLDFLTGSIETSKNAQPISLTALKKESPSFGTVCDTVKSQLKQFVKQKGISLFNKYLKKHSQASDSDNDTMS